MRLDARIQTLRLAETFRIARSSQDEAETVVVAIEHDGVTGYGEAAPIERYEESATPRSPSSQEAAGALGDDPFALEEILDRLPRREWAARAALDGALHDLQGKLLGVPTWRLLGLRRGGPPTSWTLGIGDPDETARKAEERGRPLPPLQAQARRRRRARRRARAGRARGHRRPAAGRRERVLERSTRRSTRSRSSPSSASSTCEQPLRAGDDGRRRAAAALADPGLRRRGLPHARGRRRVRADRARHQHQAREVGRDPRGGPHGARGAGARARRDARLHGRVGPRHRRRRADGDASATTSTSTATCCSPRTRGPGVELVDGVQTPADAPGPRRRRPRLNPSLPPSWPRFARRGRGRGSRRP